MFKKLLAMGIALTMGVSMMTGCSVVSDGSSSSAKESNSEAEDTADAAEDTDEAEADTSGQKIALFMTHMSNEFTVTLSSAVEAEVKARGYDYSVYDAGQDAATQADQIEQAITLGVNGIIIEPEAADCYVGADAATTGAKLMEEVMKDINSEGNIALLLGPMGSDGQIGRSEGFDQVLAKNPNVEVVFQDTAEWQTEPALTIVENWLNAGKEIKAIVAQNDGMAVGAAKAVADAQKTGEIKVYGVDATSEGLQGVLDGNLQGTISQGTEDQGKLSADACADLLEGKEVQAETIVTNVYYTADNAQEALDALGK